jgi:hypothetical protein
MKIAAKASLAATKTYEAINAEMAEILAGRKPQPPDEHFTRQLQTRTFQGGLTPSPRIK